MPPVPSRKPWCKEGKRPSIRMAPSCGWASCPTTLASPIRVSLTLFSGRHEHGGSPTRHVGGDLITDLGMWFWRPDALEPDEDIEVVFDLPARHRGLGALAGDRRAGRPPDLSSRSRPVRLAGSGGLRALHRAHRRGAGRAACVSPFSMAGRRWTRHRSSAWLQRAAAAVTMLYGRFPVPTAQVLVIPGARGDEPVPLAYVLRGGGPAAHFFINQRRPMEEFHARLERDPRAVAPAAAVRAVRGCVAVGRHRQLLSERAARTRRHHRPARSVEAHARRVQARDGKSRRA